VDKKNTHSIFTHLTKEADMSFEIWPVTSICQWCQSVSRMHQS